MRTLPYHHRCPTSGGTSIRSSSIRKFKMTYFVTIPCYKFKMAIRRPSPPQSGSLQRVVLSHRALSLRPFWLMVGTVEGTAAGDQMLVRFDETLVHVPTEWLVPADT